MSIFKSTFKPYVSRQITARQDLLATENRPAYFNRYVSGKTPWLKMTSLVDYKGSSDLARRYVLMGGSLLTQKEVSGGVTTYSQSLRGGINLKKGVAAAYGNLGDDMYGRRPMPGIESADIRSLSAYGSLREATVTFYAWDKKQLEDLEILFMRPGYYVMLEWGWSMYLDSNRDAKDTKDARADAGSLTQKVNIQSNILTQNDANVDFFGKNWTEEELYNHLDVMRHRYAGNYDGMFGKVKNFSWEFMPNGGYLCTTTLIDIGEVIDSLKISNVTTEDLGQSTNQTYQPTAFELILNKLSESYAAATTDPVISKYQIAAKDIATIDSNLIKPAEFVDKNYIYMQFAFFIYILRNQINFFDDKSNPLLNIEIPVYDDKNLGNGLCVASEDSVSVDPSVCLIDNKNAKFVCGNTDGFDLKAFSSSSTVKSYLYDNTSLGVIGNIYFNTGYLKDVYNGLLKEGSVKLGDYIRSILKGANIALGNINDFDIFTINNKMVIIDKQYTELPTETSKSKKFIVNLSGTNTAVRASKLQSKIFPSQSTLVALSAQSRENVGSVNTSTNVMMNKDIVNRIRASNTEFAQQGAVVAKTEDAKAKEAELQAIKKEKEALINNVLAIQDYISNILSGNTTAVNYSDTAASMSSALNAIILKINTDANYRAIIPTSLDVTFDGISGIVIGEIFTINQDILPKSYRSSNIGFIVTRINNNITSNAWITSLETQICLLDHENLQKDAVARNIDKTTLRRQINDIQAERNNNLANAIFIYNFLLAYCTDYFDHSGKTIKYKGEGTWLSVDNEPGRYKFYYFGDKGTLELQKFQGINTHVEQMKNYHEMSDSYFEDILKSLAVGASSIMNGVNGVERISNLSDPNATRPFSEIVMSVAQSFYIYADIYSANNEDVKATTKYLRSQIINSRAYQILGEYSLELQQLFNSVLDGLISNIDNNRKTTLRLIDRYNSINRTTGNLISPIVYRTDLVYNVTFGTGQKGTKEEVVDTKPKNKIYKLAKDVVKESALSVAIPGYALIPAIKKLF